MVYFSESEWPIEDTELAVTFPSHPNLSSNMCTPDAQTQVHNSQESYSGAVHYSSLQCVHYIGNSHLTTTDSGTICIKDQNAASKFLSKFAHIAYIDSKNFQENFHILNFDESNIKIGLEWNELQQQLILRHVSGDASRYKNLCQELISTII